MPIETGEASSAKTVTLKCQFCDSWNRVDATRATDRPRCGKCATPMLLDRPVHLDDETFARTIAASELPVLVDFYADWCGPCKVMAPSVDQLAANFVGQAVIAKLDTDASQRTAASLQIRGMPTTIVFNGGKEVSRQMGAVPYARLAAMLEGVV